MLLKLQLPKRKKIVLLAIFSLGIFITIIQIIRILTIKSLANYLDSSLLIMWSMVENNLGIIAACIPTLAPLVKAFRDKSSNRSRTGGDGPPRAGSSYALQSIGGSKGMRGFVGIGSGSESVMGRSKRGSQIIRSGDMESSSEELNSPMQSRIHKKTEVVVSRAVRMDDDDDDGMRTTYVEK